jgi:hypothetical protein
MEIIDARLFWFFLGLLGGLLTALWLLRRR